MNDLSTHFSTSEFMCSCGCGRMNAHPKLIELLERLHKNMNAKAVYINSGCRCPDHSVSVGGYRNDMHVLGGASDIRVQKQDGTFYNAFTICREAEKVGFTGIAYISPDSAHVDIRGVIPYANSHWFGNEATGENYNTFKDMGEPIQSGTTADKTIDVMLEIEGHKYSGLLSEI